MARWLPSAVVALSAALALGIVGLCAVLWRGRVIRRRSDAVRRWAPPLGSRRRIGALSVRVRGNIRDTLHVDGAADGVGKVVLLLHGGSGTGDAWGAGYDRLADRAVLVVPDLPGVGGSAAASTETVADQVTALNGVLRALGLADDPILVAGHSLGALLALHFAADRLARRPRSVTAVVCFAPLLFDGAEEKEQVVRAGRRVAAVQAGLGRRTWPRPVLAPWLSPELPGALASAAAHRDKQAYQTAVTTLTDGAAWRRALGLIAETRTLVVLAAGRNDPLVQPHRVAELVREHRGVRSAWHPSAGHDLPLGDPEWCAAVIRSARDLAGQRAATR